MHFYSPVPLTCSDFCTATTCTVLLHITELNDINTASAEQIKMSNGLHQEKLALRQSRGIKFSV